MLRDRSPHSKDDHVCVTPDSQKSNIKLSLCRDPDYFGSNSQTEQHLAVGEEGMVRSVLMLLRLHAGSSASSLFLLLTRLMDSCVPEHLSLALVQDPDYVGSLSEAESKGEVAGREQTAEDSPEVTQGEECMISDKNLEEIEGKKLSLRLVCRRCGASLHTDKS